MPDSPFATVTEVADLFLVDPSTVRRWIRTGKVKAIRIGSGDFRIERASVDQLIDESRVAM